MSPSAGRLLLFAIGIAFWKEPVCVERTDQGEKDTPPYSSVEILEHDGVLGWNIHVVNACCQYHDAVGQQQHADEEPDGDEPFAFNHCLPTKERCSKSRTQRLPRQPRILGAARAANCLQTESRLPHIPGPSA